MPIVTIGLNPVLLEIGPLPVTWHGLLTVLAVALGIAITAALAPRRGLSRQMVCSIAWWAVPGGMAGARLLHVLDDLAYYSADPWQIAAFWEGGFSLFGALLGGTIAASAYAGLKKLPVASYADLAVPGLLVGQIVGRIGDVISGAAYGSPTSLPWALRYTHPGAATTTRLEVPGHPAALYEALWDLAVLALIWRAWRRPRRDGSLFLLYAFAYSAGRFAITFWRQDRVLFLGLQQAHIVAILVMAMSVFALYHLNRAKRKTHAEGSHAP